MRRALNCCWVLLLLAVVGAASGCATGGDIENRAERPWNAPKSWEHGLPASMLEGR